MNAPLYKQLAGDALESVRFAMRPYNWMVDDPNSGPELRVTYLRVLETACRVARLDDLNALWVQSIESVPATQAKEGGAAVQLTLTEEKCRRCGAGLPIADESLFCAICSGYLDRRHKTFKRPIRPESLFAHCGYRIGPQLPDDGLIRLYQWTMFLNALLRYYTYQHFYWSQHWHTTLSQYGGEDRIAAIRQEIERRQLKPCEVENYHIDFAAIRVWIAERKREKKCQNV